MSDLFKRCHRYHASDPKGVALEGIMLCEIRQRKTILCDLTYMWNLKNNKLKTGIKFALARDRGSG